MNKILSVSIAAYNVASTLRECLDPFLESEVMEFLDIMIVDDGSKDKTAVIAKEYQDKYPDSIRLIQKQNGGWGSTVNSGIQNAKGKYFKQLDGDDYYEPKALNEFIAYLDSQSSDMVIAPYITYDSETGAVITTENCNPGCEVRKVFALKDVEGFSPFMHSLAIKTELLKKGNVKVTEHCFYTDTEFVLKACNQAETVSFFDMPVYYYRRAAVGQSMSLGGFEKHYMEQYKVIEVSLDYLHTDVKRAEVKKIYDKLLVGTCWWQYLIMFYISVTPEHKHNLIAFDKMLKAKAPDYYDQIHFRELDILRKTHFLGYSILAPYKKKKDNRFTEDGRLAN
ncbi:glycosyltransferase family A protein [Brotaphodocola catenula]|uniref:Glycosyltransferase family 2 protein n=1 Tax=Brotaphodocola catenula TaxID=2885361 RepID=A0AAE3DKB2_9FIRM|nr:glycosyltransferase family A protein [Brotaphodocola catenula]MCC2165124.1 glycosyltransferase family 2 protein [Brotaphodocola catenula]